MTSNLSNKFTEFDCQSLQRVCARRDELNDGQFLENFMACYGFPRALTGRLVKGTGNMSRKPGCYHLAGMFIAQFHPADESPSREAQEEKALEGVLEEAIGSATTGERFAIAFGRDRLLARNLRTGQTLDAPLAEFHRNHEFLDHWCGLVCEGKGGADIQEVSTKLAVERFNAFFDQLQKDENSLIKISFSHGRDSKGNPIYKQWMRPFTMTDDRALFFVRIVFCLCADSYDLFCPERPGSHLFLRFLESIRETKLTSIRLADLFVNLHVKKGDRKTDLDPSVAAFPYIGSDFLKRNCKGGVVPWMFEDSRNALIKCAELDWRMVRLADFATWFQAHVTDKNYFYGVCPDPNFAVACKILNPLFLERMRKELEEAKRTSEIQAKRERLARLRREIWNTKVFDPDCGTGALLTAAFQVLRDLECEAIEEGGGDGLPDFNMSLENFQGYAQNEFARGICQVALWMERHRAYERLRKRSEHARPTIPCETVANIERRPLGYLEDWPEDLSPRGESGGAYICCASAPLGIGEMAESDQAKMREILSPIDGRRPSALNYAACGTMKAVQYVKRHPSVSFGFLCMDSSGRGDFNDTLWPADMDREMDVYYASASFSDSKGNPSAGIGLLSFAVRKRNPGAGGGRADGENLSCSEGSIELGGGNLILTQEEYGQLSRGEKDLCKPYLSHDDILHGRTRYCLWIDESNRDEALGHDWIRRRLDQVREFREKSENAFVRKCAAVPWAFLLRQPFVPGPSLVVPARIPQPVRYVPVAYLEQESVVAHPDVIFPNPPLWLFALFSSAMYSAWIADDRNVQSACERCASFPIPALTAEQKAALEEKGRNILAVRKILDYISLAEHYYSPRMRIPLLGVHLQNDLVVDGIYGGEGVTMSLEARRTLLRGMAEKVKGG